MTTAHGTHQQDEAAGPGTGAGAAGTDDGRPTDSPVALVTGASSGIGAEIARRLAAERRWRLLLNGRDPGRLGAVAGEAGGTALAAPLDSAEDSAGLAERALAEGGRVDVLVACAGSGWAGPFISMPPAEIDRTLHANVTGTLHLVRALLPRMVERGRGHIVLTSSVAACFGVAEEAVYAGAKAALRTFGESLRYELAHSGVRVTVVLPGVVDTPFFARRQVPYRRRRPRPVPAGRVADVVSQALARGRDEVFVPGWLSVPARMQGAAPGLFRRAAARFG